MTDDASIPLFSYGTLQLESVQLAQFGRRLEGEPDAITGYRLSTVRIGDPTVVGFSGTEEHLILVETGDPADEVAGVVFRITAAELAAADEYETSDYARIEAPLKSGRTAWVYVEPPRQDLEGF